MINNELINKDPDMVRENEPIIIIDGKPPTYITSNGKDTKQTRKFIGG